MNTSIDVVIPTFDRPLLAEKLTASLAPHLSENDRMFIVWQGNARPDIRETGSVRLLHSSPPSLPRARNTGVKAGQGGIVLFLDDDVVVLPGLLEGHRQAYNDRSVGAVAGRLIDPLFDNKENEAATFDETTGRLVQNFCVDKSQYTVSVMGANMSFRRDALNAVGLFDENISRNALWEEVDAAFRVRAAGYAIWYCSTATVRHLREKTGGCRTDHGRRYIYHQFANTAYFAARHCRPTYAKSWFTYWKHRLEYESRKNMLWFHHDPFMVGAGIAGALAGIVRYAVRGRS